MADLTVAKGVFNGVTNTVTQIQDSAAPGLLLVLTHHLCFDGTASTNNFFQSLFFPSNEVWDQSFQLREKRLSTD
jgi:hypothetical protein